VTSMTTTQEFPGFLVTAKGRYITHADFLAFIGRAAKYEGFDGDDPVRAWLRAHKYPADLEQLTPTQVSYALSAAQAVILEQSPRARHL